MSTLLTIRAAALHSLRATKGSETMINATAVSPAFISRDRLQTCLCNGLNNFAATLMLILLFLFTVAASASFASADIINPHWTGKHCGECHEGGKPPELHSGGDVNAMCNRCHGPGSEAGSEVHPVNITVPDLIRGRIPEGWPLNKGKISCLTCHDVKAQMYVDVVQQKFNKNFLRQVQTADRPFCFTCHDKDKFHKLNPHKQADADRAVCLNCHQNVPDPAQAQSNVDAPLKADSDTICAGCHAQQLKAHPAQADHLVQPSEKVKESLRTTGALLKISGDTINCVTCHNPHDKGVIKRKKAEAGAGEHFLLRVNGGYELCIACHDAFTLTRRGTTLPPSRNVLKEPPEMLTPHKPWAENKCKACHAVTVEQREKPQPTQLCFRQGCHKIETTDKEFMHEISVLKNCYFCHENHASEYKKLLRSNEERICYTCHPLLRDKNGKRAEVRDARALHVVFTDYVRGLDIGADNECNFCHSPSHKAQISKLPTGLCADCHITVRNALVKAAGGMVNLHDGFNEKLCSACHDPHASAYKYQLKKPVESYK